MDTQVKPPRSRASRRGRRARRRARAREVGVRAGDGDDAERGGVRARDGGVRALRGVRVRDDAGDAAAVRIRRLRGVVRVSDAVSLRRGHGDGVEER